jgi:LPS-assembly protein
MRHVKYFLQFVTIFFLISSSVGISGASKKTTPVQNDSENVQACVKKNITINELENKLGWVSNSKEICKGHFLQPTIGYQEAFYLAADDMNLAFEGESTVKGHVQVKHQDKIITADTAHIYRKQGKVVRIKLLGNLQFEEPNYRITATSADMDVQKFSGRLDNVVYRLFLKSDNEEQASTNGILAAWGQACFIDRDEKGNLTLENLTYSTCPPNNMTWKLKANKLLLQKKESKGTAESATLYLKDTPILYLPYISFPLDDKRKSGFLASELAFTSQNGFDYKLPYYFNIAPNMDVTLFPHYFSRRGWMLGGEARYLHGWGIGSLEAHYLHNDREFRAFKQTNSWQAPQLLGLKDNRYSFKWENETNLSDEINIQVDYEKVSDDYYLQDFNNNLVQTSQNQLPQQLVVKYKTLHWVYQAILQRYQTLHPFNQSVVSDVFQRLPSLSAMGFYPDLPYDFIFKVFVQMDRFVWQGDNWLNTPQGNRYHIKPTIGFDVQKEGYFINPELSFNMTQYELSHYNSSAKNISRTIPMFSVDSGLIFERSIKGRWTQTLEPRLYYLYVPYVHQTGVPIFDTSYFFQTYNQLFRDNRFAGLDRVGDANQISLGISSRLINDLSGVEQLRVSLGTSYKFHKDRVFLCQNFVGNVCLDNANRVGFVTPDAGFSPIQLETELNVSSRFKVFNNVAWDLRQSGKLNNALVDVQFEPKRNHIMNVGYGYLSNGDQTNLANGVRNNTNLHQFRISYAWPHSEHWRTLGSVNYNISHGFAMSYFMGIQYDDCCVAFRLIGGRVYRYYGSQGAPVYGNNVYAQVLLKGLGSAANNSPSGILTNFLPSFRDEFKS